MSKLEEMIVALLAAELQIDPDEIDPDQPFEIYGVDSDAIVSLSGTINDKLPELVLEPTLLFDYPTVAAVAAYLEEEVNRAYKVSEQQ